MKIPAFLNPYTIRQRVMLLNGLVVVLVCSLVTIYTFQLMAMENDLMTMKRVDDVFSSILELRRHEKNIMLELDESNVPSVREALSQTATHIAEFAAEVDTSEGVEKIKLLRESLGQYDLIFERWCSTSDCLSSDPGNEDAHLIRRQGQDLVDKAADLARFNREEISARFKKILFWLTFIPAAAFCGGAIVFFSQVKSILNRLSSLKQGAKTLAAGEFKTIPPSGFQDEISQLANNFNLMVVALEQKQEELIQSKKMASIGTFSSGIAHEINNPLNNISLSTDTLIEEFDSLDDEESMEILDDIMVQTERASKIVRNLLNFSRAQSSETQALYIDFVLHKTTDLIANELRINHVLLHKDIADSMPQVVGDLQKLQQVFLNLIINAEQAVGESGQITVKARATDNGFIRTDISDNGSGIAQENLEQIFDPFFTTKEAGKGTGLGLSIVYAIVKKHNGYIEVASKIGEGTTFSVYLPVCTDETVDGE